MKKRYSASLSPLSFGIFMSVITLATFLVSIILSKPDDRIVLIVIFIIAFAVYLFLCVSLIAERFSVDENGISFYCFNREKFFFPWTDIESAVISFVPRAGCTFQFTTNKDVTFGLEARKATKKLLNTYAPKEILEMLEESRKIQNLKI